MIKSIKILLAFLIMIGSLTLLNAAPNVYLEAPSTGVVNKSISVKIKNYNSGNIALHGTLSVEGAATGSVTIAMPADGEQSLLITPKTAGTVTVKFNGHYSVSGEFKDIPLNISRRISITTPPSGGGGGNTKPPTGGGGGSTNPPSTGGGGGSTVPGNDGTYKPELPLGETDEEKKAREEREAALEREKELKTPLIEKIEVTSNSDKRRDKVISTFTPEFEKFNFEYLVPMNIDSVKLNVVGVDDSVVLTYEDEYDVSKDSEVVVKAVKGDVTQEFKLNFKSKADSLVKRDDGVIYADEELDKSMVALGFEITDVDVDGVTSQMFTRGALNLQLVVDEDNKAEFYRLDEAGEVVDRGQLINEESEVFFVGAYLPEDLVDYTLYGNGVSAVSIEVPEYLSVVDESLSLKNNIKGWTYDEGIVVYAYDDQLFSDFFRIKPQSSLKSAVVAFDIEDNTILYTLYGVSVALVVTIIAFLSYFLVQRKKARRV